MSPLMICITNPLLTSADQVTIYFLKDLINGRKKRILGKDVRHISIPSYEGLSIKDIAKFVAPYNTIDHYLPDKKEYLKLPKQWIANVCATILKGVFSDWVSRQVEKRNNELLVNRGLNIEMDADIAAAFHASSKTSSK